MDRFSKYRCLLVLAKSGNYSTAAHQLGMSQPALSRSIQALEQSLGNRLVDRSGKGARLTPMGVEVLEQARRILREVDDLDHEINQIHDVEIGHFAFGAGPYPTVLLIPRLLAALSQRFPRLEVTFEMENWRLLMARLKHRKLELVIAEASEAEADLELDVTLLKPLSGSLVVRAGHPLLDCQLSSAAIGRYPFATATLPYRILATFQGAFGLRWRPAFQCDDVRLLLAFVKRTDAITLASSAIIENDPDLVALNFEDAPVESRFGMIRLVNRTPSLVTRAVMEELHAMDLNE